MSKKTSVLKGVTAKYKQRHPVKRTRDGTPYREFGDLLWFDVKIKQKGYDEVYAGCVINHDHDEWEPVEPYIVIETAELDSRGERLHRQFDESVIEWIEVTARPENDMNFWGKIPGPEDGYWDDDFVHEPQDQKD